MITQDTKATAKRMTYRYFLINSKTGGFRDRNEHGKFLDFAFKQLNTAIRYCRRAPETEVYDSILDRWVYFNG